MFDHPAAISLGYAAFVQLRRPTYRRYACARLGDGDLGGEVVEQAFRQTALSWASVLAGHPDAFVWGVLRDAVARALPASGRRDSDHLHRDLPARTADVALLHERLGLSIGAAAALMGLDEAVLHVELMTARRLLAGRRGDPAG